ncbi:class I adenylate-forming enzyme family protein [Sandaracinus amylolyticus]|uniref:class I adenylate-forming enzyme family protein n=1 Tax=Sandaracinus amylolyticus TaxID=927083 RepID=UPI001F20A6DA|nr:AMP-binding protein [Sandaracinus amylolyticus]UJR85072.1 Hypothetical protein I5071_71510 [Sandaracinus amylolyticus]
MSEPLSVRAAARERGDADALIDEDGDAISWRTLAAEVDAQIAMLAAHGVDGRDPAARVAVVGSPTRVHIVDVLAAIEIGAPLVMLHPRWTDAERDVVIDESAPRVVLPTQTEVHVGHEPPRTREDTIDPARTLAVLYTSGTTGKAKGALLSRRAFLASARASAVNLPLTPSDRWLLCMPIAHVGGLSIVVRSLIARSTIVLAGPFDEARARDTIGARSITLVSLVPTMLARLLDAGFARPPALRTILLGGAACPERVLMRAIAANLPLRTTYGLTEACSQVSTARDDVRSLDEGAGHPLPGTGVRIGARGTIEVRGPTMFDGWLGQVASPFDADGWYDTGDLGELDARGHLHVLARRTDLIVSGGENVYPAEVEAALERVEGVRAACVFGVPDDRWGQIVAAAIVVDDRAPDDATITRALSGVLARFKRPRRIARLPALVVAGSGKLDRRATADAATPLLRALEVHDG